MATDKQVLGALRGVLHAEVKRDLMELGTIKDADMDDGMITVTLALPF
jgi:metal-sulfur cluster biosynthetic enzyme